MRRLLRLCKESINSKCHNTILKNKAAYFLQKFFCTKKTTLYHTFKTQKQTTNFNIVISKLQHRRKVLE